MKTEQLDKIQAAFDKAWAFYSGRSSIVSESTVGLVDISKSVPGLVKEAYRLRSLLRRVCHDVVFKASDFKGGATFQCALDCLRCELEKSENL